MASEALNDSKFAPQERRTAPQDLIVISMGSAVETTAGQK